MSDVIVPPAPVSSTTLAITTQGTDFTQAGLLHAGGFASTVRDVSGAAHTIVSDGSGDVLHFGADMACASGAIRRPTRVPAARCSLPAAAPTP